jgi:hypothetical protein
MKVCIGDVYRECSPQSPAPVIGADVLDRQFTTIFRFLYPLRLRAESQEASELHGTPVLATKGSGSEGGGMKES